MSARESVENTGETVLRNIALTGMYTGFTWGFVNLMALGGSDDTESFDGLSLFELDELFVLFIGGLALRGFATWLVDVEKHMKN